jgi:thioesterase domain-containing protein
MIDTYLPNQSAHPQDALRSRFRRFLKSVQAAPKDLPDLLLQSGLRTLIRASAFSLLHIMHKLANLLGSRASLAFHWRMAEQLRLHAFHKWNLRPLDVPTTLFRSKDPRSTLGDDGWGALCRQLTVVEIGGSHFSLLEPPLLQLLCEHFLEALGKHDHGRARPT